MSGANRWSCQTCGSTQLADGEDGFFYCSQCNSQAEDYMETGVADEDLFNNQSNTLGGLYSARHARHASAIKHEPFFSLPYEYDHPGTPFRQSKTEQDHHSDGGGDQKELSLEDYYSAVRLKYVSGLQRMIQLQCEALVREFKVSPLICGLSGTVWLRLLAATRVFADGWADRAFNDSEMRSQGEAPEELKPPRCKYSAEPHTSYGKRAVMVWLRSLRKTIPLSYTLAVSFLACHLSREAVLPTDIVKWSVERKLPYFSAYLEIEKDLGGPSRDCPLSSSLMFEPINEFVPVQKLESLAAVIAQIIGLYLPPVNFYAIASRYLNKLCLPFEKILPHACRIYEWSMPSELWLSTNEFRLPTRVFVMSIVIIAVRILYKLHGFGEWEKSLSTRCGLTSSSNHLGGDLDPTSSSNARSGAEEDSASPFQNVDDSCTKNLSNAQTSELDAAELLSNLDARYNEVADTYDYCKDLPTYLQFCKDDVFAGSKASFKDQTEDELIEMLWEFYQSGKVKDSEAANEQGVSCDSSPNQKRLRDNEKCSTDLSKQKEFSNKGRGTRSSSVRAQNSSADDQEMSKDGVRSCGSPQNSQSSKANDEETLRAEAIRRMKLDMEEKRFCYIPPRVNIKRLDYLHYERKKDEGAYTYVAHADYYILLRAGARVAQVEIRCMHIAVLSVERRLAWLEKRIDHCFHLTPPVLSCKYCSDMVPENTVHDEENEV